jgi:nicotinamidase-related amidase
MELNPSTTAVVAVHMQGDIVTAAGAFGGSFAAQVEERNVIAQVGALLTAARASGATAAYTRVVYAPDYSNLNANSPLLGMVAQFGCLAEGQPNAEIIDALTPQEGDLVVEHQRVAGFSASTLDADLRARGVDTIVFCGVATNASVEGTARMASDLGYRTIVVTDACSTVSPEAHEASIGSLSLLAEIATVADVVAAFGA